MKRLTWRLVTLTIEKRPTDLAEKFQRVASAAVEFFDFFKCEEKDRPMERK